MNISKIKSRAKDALRLFSVRCCLFARVDLGKHAVIDLNKPIKKGNYVYGKENDCFYKVWKIKDGDYHVKMVDRFGKQCRHYGNVFRIHEIARVIIRK